VCLSSSTSDEPSELRIEVSPDAAETIVQGGRFKTPAENPDLRIGRVEVFSVLAIDLAELVARPVEDRRILQRLRAEDRLFSALKRSLIGTISECSDEAEIIRSRMTDSLKLGGKAVWTDQFLDRFAPIRLPAPKNLIQNERPVTLSQRLSGDRNSPLHFLRFQDHVLKMFRDGTISYTVQTSFEDHLSKSHGGASMPPATIGQAIDRLNALNDLLAENFRIVLSDLIRSRVFQKAISDGVQYSRQRLQLMSESDLHASDLKRRSKAHTAIFVERFFDGERGATLTSVTDDSAETAEVALKNVVASSSLAGLLNTASWYRFYDHRYVQRLRRKEIGYRDDEIYLSDGDATVISARGFWAEGSGASHPADPLSRYKLDVVLAIQYNVACVAYCGSTLAYYQSHPDVSDLENSKPLKALPYVIDGRAILSHLDQALDLALLVDHGFTRAFIERLREELDVDAAVSFIRQRVEDSSTSVGLKSAVLSAEHTSKEGLSAALENNKIQRTIRAWAIIAIVVAIVLFSIGEYLQSSRRPSTTLVCKPMGNAANMICRTVQRNP
jgi:hypothetical protein